MQKHQSTHRPHASTRRLGASMGTILAAIAVIAVIIIGYLLIRGGGTNEVQEQTQQQTEELQQEFGAAEARTRLSALRSDIEAELDQEALRERYEGIRGDLEEGYANASGEAADAWDELQPRLDELGEQIEQGSENAAETIDEMLTSLESP